ncbi:nucleoside-diphosphate sugar epimerase/dehydratase [Sulfurimonas sp. C5]|uniref:polysaccharide biosynthesis protein n=1 Tax=Sulfurimonas sp. C5 TaxID=3036947 RepID=UPI0024586ACB|nr:nucleoside-diphosphate sugar epimerase/dehydratase [Sulfurimonas sp. C5]MDH4944061.1 nucleoside-diphosphate sugar epimerase/dehydratase [Sulfurimonas sp. C5]
MILDKRILNILVIIFLTTITFLWTFFIFHQTVNWQIIAVVIFFRLFASFTIYKDYSLSWSKATQKTFLLKTVVVIVPLVIYIPIFHGEVRMSFMLSEAMTYLASISFLMYMYYFFINQSRISKTKTMVIYGAGKAGIKIEEEFRNSEYKITYFCDDDKVLQGRSIDGIRILSGEELETKSEGRKYDLLIIAMPSVSKDVIQKVYNRFHNSFHAVKILPSLNDMLNGEALSTQLKDISVEDLLARDPKDLDKKAIEKFIVNKKVLITGAGGSIGSEISRQCAFFGAKELVLLEHSEFNLYQIAEELAEYNPKLVMQSVVNKDLLDATFEKYKPEIVIHAAAYKHVPLVEDNIEEAIINNILGTKNAIDCAIEHNVEKFVLISTDKAVRPTNVMGTTKRICELYAQNIASNTMTEIVAVRFGNVLGSSGSVIPKFKLQIENGGPITVTHPDITRYFMLIPEACELVLQAASIGKGGEIFILDMGEPIKIVDLAKKMIELSGRDDIEIEFSGLRPGEKLYEELLISDSDTKTQYESITVAGRTEYNIEKLSSDINELVNTKNKLAKLKEIVPEFNHQNGK